MRYHDITVCDMKNGDGLRTVLWISGCEHGCPGCQNPVTWNPDDGLEFDEAAYTELFDSLKNDYISGLTLSGGDPLYPGNRDVVLNICRSLKSMDPKKTIWLYTGYTYEEIQDLDIMNYVDVCVDGRFIQNEADNKLHWKGSANQRVIDVKISRVNGRICLHGEAV